TWPTQPFPVKPAPLARTTPITAADLSRVTPASQAECEALFAKVQTSGGLYTPIGTDVTLTFPGTLGGATWSGGTVDVTRGLLIVNTNEVGALATLAPDGKGSYRRTGPLGEYGRFWDSRQLSCQAPPWGRLNAVDLSTGDIA